MKYCSIMKDIQVVITLLLCVLTAWAQVHYDDDYYEDENGAQETADPPKFLATPQSFSVEIGDEITLPCDVDKQGKHNISHPLVFKFMYSPRQDRTIYVGDIKIRRNSRIRKVGNSFVIPNVKKSDAGEYICRFETEPIVQLSHNLNVQFPAKVARVSDEVQIVAQGSSVTLECEAKGNPRPAITWSKKQGHLPSGAKSEEGLSLTFEQVDRHVEGTYICTAANGIGEPSSTAVSVQVEYEPEIISEQAILSVAGGYEAILTCIVHGRPTPTVSWYRGESPVSSEKHVMTHDGAHRHTLKIKQVSEEDFGGYICTAENKYGKKENSLYLTGIPKQPVMTSSPAGGEKTSYTLTWTTETFAPIMQYRLKYKKVSDSPSHNGPVPWSTDQLYSPVRTSIRETRFSRGLIEMKHPLADLEPAEDYEAIVQVENKFGWSPDSEIFRFFTRKEMAVGRSASGAGRLQQSLSLALVATVVASIFFL